MEDKIKIECPECKETIIKGASKCKHCGTYLETVKDNSWTGQIIWLSFLSILFWLASLLIVSMISNDDGTAINIFIPRGVLHTAPYTHISGYTVGGDPMFSETRDLTFLGWVVLLLIFGLFEYYIVYKRTFKNFIKKRKN